MFRIISVLLLFLIAGCDVAPDGRVSFDENEVAYVKAEGQATVSGQGFARRGDGDVVTCSGQNMGLIPAGGYAVNFMTKLFGSPQGGNIPIEQAFRARHPEGFSRLRKVTICDASGGFKFDNVADGDYYLVTVVQWQNGGSAAPGGSVLGRLIRVSGGQNQNVVLN